MNAKLFYLTFFLILPALWFKAPAQCNVTIPSTATVIDAPGMSVSGIGKSIWLCDSLTSSSGIDNIYFIESGAYYAGSGIGITSYLKSGGIYNHSGLNDTLYHEPGAIILNQPSVAIPCAAIVFDYTNAPTSNCQIQLPPPIAGFTASKDTICTNRCIDFSDTSVTTGTTTWQWNFPGGTPATSTVKNPTSICYDSAGTFTARLVVSDTAGTDTATFNIYVDACLSLPENALDGVTFFPNPVKDILNFNSYYQIVDVEIIDVYGKNHAVPLSGTQLNVSEFSAGIYYIRITTNLGITYTRFVKE